MEWKEGQTHDTERPVWNQTEFMAHGGSKSRRTGVRGSIVARKPGNAGGAKGTRKMDDE